MKNYILNKLKLQLNLSFTYGELTNDDYHHLDEKNFFMTNMYLNKQETLLFQFNKDGDIAKGEIEKHSKNTLC